MKSNAISATGAASASPRMIAPQALEADENGRPQLVGGKCASCGALSFPKAEVCSDCMSDAVRPQLLQGEGVLYSYTTVHQAPRGWRVPFVLGYVDLANGLRLLAHIQARPEALRIGLSMRLATGVVAADEAGTPLATYVFTTPEERHA
jgi:uncharacterized protein